MLIEKTHMFANVSLRFDQIFHILLSVADCLCRKSVIKCNWILVFSLYVCHDASFRVTPLILIITQ